MKLVKQIRLHFQEGSSDKVYEIDLCEVGAGRYVVNYRFGRRGARLQSGSQTPAPVAQAEAQRVFDTLSQSKIRKGYREIVDGDARPAAPAPARKRPTSGGPTSEQRSQAILKRLSSPSSKGWPLERVIWRAGELRLRAAAPLLIRLIGTASSHGPLRDYCIAWALGQLEEQAAVEPLVRLWRSPTAAEPVRRMAVEALRRLSDPDTRAEMSRDLLNELPIEVRKPAQSGDTEALILAVRTYLEGEAPADPAAPAAKPAAPAKRRRPVDEDDEDDEDDDDADDDDDDDDDRGKTPLPEVKGKPERYEILETLYIIDSPKVRPALLSLLRSVPLIPNYFQRLRHIFKAAEYRRDGEVFGILAYRFEKERGYYHSGYRHSRYVTLRNGRSLSLKRKDVKAEIVAADAQIAYSQKTRNYLRRRVWRTLRRMGERDELDFVTMAVGVLLPFTDADAVPARKRGRNNNWDVFAPYFALNHILYGKSPRYKPPVNAIAWRCKGSYKPGDPEPAGREESFPKLWTDRPQGLLHLLSESQCRPVHSFAVKALRTVPDLLESLDVDAVIMLIGRPYEVTAQLGCELGEKRYRSSAPDHGLVLAMASCVYAPGRATAVRWIDENRSHFLADSELILSLCLSAHADTRAFALRLLRSTTLPDAAANSLIVRMVAHLMSLGAEQAEQARDVSAILLQSLGPSLRRVGVRVLLDLLRHPLREVQELGANLLLQHETGPAALPPAELDALLGSLLESPFESVRALGMRLLGQIPERLLVQQQDLWRALCTHPLADLRNAARPILKRLAPSHRDFAERLTALFIAALFEKEPAEGVHSSLVRTLREDLPRGLDGISREDALRLCAAKSQQAQELGGVILKAHPEWADHFSTVDIVKLGSAEVKTVREAGWALYTYALPRFRESANDLSQAVRLLEAKWEDSREFAQKTIRESFDERHLSPEILVGICDSVRPEVQELGRELITRFFAEAHGQDYLLKLSEHPTPELQEFATNYLERFAAGDIGRLQTLRPYFVSVLSRVNKGRLSKSRVFDFLIAEARKSEAAARLASEILERVSATIAIGDRARAIEAMVEIRLLHPGVPLPILVRPKEMRGAV